MSHLLLSDVEHSVPDVVSGHLPVPVYQAAPPAVLTHWKRRSGGKMKECEIRWHEVRSPHFKPAELLEL